MLDIYNNFKVSINMDFFTQLSSDVRKFRKDNGWSQQQLADMAGLDRTTISALERNKFNDIGIRKVQRVLQVLGHSLAIQSVGLPNLDDMQRYNRENGWWRMSIRMLNMSRIESVFGSYCELIITVWPA